MSNILNNSNKNQEINKDFLKMRAKLLIDEKNF